MRGQHLRYTYQPGQCSAFFCGCCAAPQPPAHPSCVWPRVHTLHVAWAQPRPAVWILGLSKASFASGWSWSPVNSWHLAPAGFGVCGLFPTSHALQYPAFASCASAQHGMPSAHHTPGSNRVILPCCFTVLSENESCQSCSTHAAFALVLKFVSPQIWYSCLQSEHPRTVQHLCSCVLSTHVPYVAVCHVFMLMIPRKTPTHAPINPTLLPLGYLHLPGQHCFATPLRVSRSTAFRMPLGPRIRCFQKHAF